MSNLTDLGDFLRKARAAKELTLRDVEEKTDISNAYLSQIEGAKIKQPSPVTLHKLCELYGAAYSVAMELAGYPVPKARQVGAGQQRFLARLGTTTPEEETELLDYLHFIRTKNGKRRM